MAYADYNFYIQGYHGEHTHEDGIELWLERASDELDVLTFGRLMSAFPVEDTHASKVKKAVCAIADALYQVDVQRKSAAPQKQEDGSYHGAVSSISSGGESISYAKADSGSIYAEAAASKEKEFELVRGLAYKYLAGIPDANGVNLLYAGVG